MDFFAENTIKRIIGELIENKGSIKDDKAMWFALTRRMFMIYPSFEVYELVEKALEEASDSQWFENKYPEEIFNEKFVIPKEEERKFNTPNPIRDLINSRLKITDVAKGYGLTVDSKGKTLCPFHYDSDPSLKLDDNKNVFYCFGCHKKGDIITFIKFMEIDKRDDNKNRR